MNLTNTYDGQHDLLADDNFLAPPEYAGFWLRAVAYIIDVIIIYAASFVIAITFGMKSSLISIDDSGPSGAGIIILYLLILSYFPVLESSKWQGTIGKRVVGLSVTNLLGDRISFPNALGRFFAKIISVIILYIGFFMIGFTEKKQGLHDMIANTLVIKT